jgi:hypothetical protein
MRSSSIKSLIAVASIAFTIVIAVPRAEAKPSQPQRASQTAQAQPGTIDRIQRSVDQLIRRIFSIRTNGNLPGEPIPVSFSSDDPTATPLDPKKQR